MTQAATNTDNTHSNAVAAVKKRFIGVPSSTSNDKFMDLVTGTVQGGSGVLRAFYKQMGGTDTKASGAYLLACLDYSYGDGFEPNGRCISTGLIACRVKIYTSPASRPPRNRAKHSEMRVLFKISP